MSYTGLGQASATSDAALREALRLRMESGHACPDSGATIPCRADQITVVTDPVCGYYRCEPRTGVAVPRVVESSPSPWSDRFRLGGGGRWSIPGAEMLAFYGIVGLGALIGGGIARSRGKSWGAAIGYGALGGTVFGGGRIYYRLHGYGGVR